MKLESQESNKHTAADRQSHRKREISDRKKEREGERLATDIPGQAIKEFNRSSCLVDSRIESCCKYIFKKKNKNNNNTHIRYRKYENTKIKRENHGGSSQSANIAGATFAV